MGDGSVSRPAYTHGRHDGAAGLPFGGFRQYRANRDRLDYGEGFTDALLERPHRTGRA